MGFCNNALITKMRAMNSRRLVARDYEELLKKSYVSDIVRYLKGTHFEEILRGVDAGSIRCEELEDLLKASRIADYEKLLNYVSKDGKNFFSLFWAKLETEELLLALQLFKAGRLEKFAIVHSAKVVKKMKLNVLELISAHSTDDFLRVVGDVEGAAVLRPELEGNLPEDIDILRCEKKLNVYLCNLVSAEINKANKEAKLQMAKEFFRAADSYNLNIIYRARKNYNYSPDKIIELLLPIGNLAGSKNRRANLSFKISNDFERLFESNGYDFKQGGSVAGVGSKLSSKRKNEMERTLKTARYAPLAFWNFVGLADLEVKNLVSVIEGVFNKCKSKEIEKFLVC